MWDEYIEMSPSFYERCLVFGLFVLLLYGIGFPALDNWMQESSRQEVVQKN
jgi:hypothetical protein